ncbi:hypothetical protein ACERJO_19655, partial [Halalkalibacter sp. AB-rgal2]
MAVVPVLKKTVNNKNDFLSMMTRTLAFYLRNHQQGTVQDTLSMLEKLNEDVLEDMFDEFMDVYHEQTTIFIRSSLKACYPLQGGNDYDKKKFIK